MGRRIIKKVIEVEEEVWTCAITGEDIQPGQEHTLTLDNKKFIICPDQFENLLCILSDDDGEDYVEEQEPTTEKKEEDPGNSPPPAIRVSDTDVDVLDHSNLNASSVRKLAASRTPPPGYKPHDENKPDETEEGFDSYLSAERHRVNINSPEVREKMKRRVNKGSADKELGEQSNRKSVRIKDHDFK